MLSLVLYASGFCLGWLLASWQARRRLVRALAAERRAGLAKTLDVAASVHEAWRDKLHSYGKSVKGKGYRKQVDDGDSE